MRGCFTPGVVWWCLGSAIPQGKHSAIFDSVDCRNRAQTPCVADTTVRAAVPIVAVLSRRTPINVVIIPAANREVAKNTATVRISATRAAVRFVVGIAARIVVGEQISQK